MAYSQVCLKLGDAERAEMLLRRAHSLAVRNFGEVSMLRANSAQRLGLLYTTQRDYKRAEPLLREALDQARKITGEKSEFYAFNLELLANLLRDQGDVLLPGPLYQQALDIRTALAGGETHILNELLLDRGRMHMSRGDFELAAADFDKADVLFKQFSPGRISTACQQCQADLAFQQGNKVRAAELYDILLARATGVVAKVTSKQTEMQQLALAQGLSEQLCNILSLEPEGEALRKAYDQVLAWKGSAFARQHSLRNMRGNEKLPTLFQQWENLTGQVATLALHAPYSEDRDVWMLQVRQVMADRDAVETELANAANSQPPSVVGTAQVQGLIQKKMALVDFVEFTRRIPSPRQKGQWDVEQYLVAFVVRSEGPIACIKLGPAKAAAEEIDAWLQTNELSEPSKPASLAELTRLGQPIRTRLWDPLQESLKGADVILVSPAGALTRFPLGALPGKESDSFLIEERSLVMVPFSALLPELLHAPALTDIGALVTFGDVAYGGSAGRTDVRQASSGNSVDRRSRLSGGFGKLENTGPEIDGVAGRYDISFHSASVRPFKGEQATEGAFRQQAPKARWLHLATHGFYAPDLMESALAPASSDSTSTAGVPPTDLHLGVKFHPGLLSGLALAGANSPNRPEDDDGILSAIEVAALDLSNVELAVLSACQTAQGKEAGGEGVLGLQRAFQLAGARSVVATYWPIEDQASRVLMMRFYRNLWDKKLTKLEALNEAQRWMIAGSRTALRAGESPMEFSIDSDKLPPNYLHPSVWAPFVLSGDWR